MELVGHLLSETMVVIGNTIVQTTAAFNKYLFEWLEKEDPIYIKGIYEHYVNKIKFLTDTCAYQLQPKFIREFPIDRMGKFQTHLKTSPVFPWIENKYHKDIEDMSFSDIMLQNARDIASYDKQIDFFWSGGIDSTAALIALVKVCPDQLRVIIGRSCEYEDYLENVVKKLNHIVYNEDIMDDFYSLAKTDQNILSGGAEADMVFGFHTRWGGPGIDTIKDIDFWYNRNNFKIMWRNKRRFYWHYMGWRWFGECSFDKIELENYRPFFVLPTIEKWLVNHERNDDLEFYIEGYHPNFHTKISENELTVEMKKEKLEGQEVFLCKKSYLRNFIYEQTGDASYAFAKNKIASGLRILDNTRSRVYMNHRIMAVRDDGRLITTDNIGKLDLSQFLNDW
jgi:hypothetical protein